MFRALALFAAAAAPSAAQAQISVIRSSASGEKWAPQPSLAWRAATPSSGANVSILRALKQTLLGFGAAFTDTSAYNAIVLMNESSRREFVDAYWGPRGLDFALGRVHINSPDYAFASYNLDNVSGDWSLLHFDAGMAYDSQRVLPLMRLAQAAAGAPLRLFGSPWSPPAWMKKPCQCCHDMICSAAAPCLLDDAGGRSARATWAAYIVKWLDAMAAHGFRMWGLTPQNEPEAIQQKFESCAFAPADMADFIGGYLGPALAEQWADLHVMGYDHNRLHALTWAQALLGNASVAKYVDSFAVHWYDYAQSLGLDNLAAIRQLLGPDAPFLNTESCYLQSLVIDWRIGELYMADIFGSLNFGLGGWMGWNLVLLTGDRYPQWLGGWSRVASAHALPARLPAEPKQTPPARAPRHSRHNRPQPRWHADVWRRSAPGAERVRHGAAYLSAFVLHSRACLSFCAAGCAAAAVWRPRRGRLGRRLR
jgi:glucosylceramidase